MTNIIQFPKDKIVRPEVDNIKKSFLKCWVGIHEWETLQSIAMHDTSFGEPAFYYQTRKQCKCKTCGAWKTFIIK